MSNPSPTLTHANARRQEIVTENIAAASAWLDEIDPDIFDYRRAIIARNMKSSGDYFLKVYTKEYATLRNIHPRTARRYLDAALQLTRPAPRPAEMTQETA